MADTYTTNLNLTKPEPGAAEDTWGISLNADLDALDAIFSSSGTQINLNPNQINFADGKKAVFNSNLNIFSTGTSSYIEEVGTGDLYLKASNLYITDRENNQFMSMIDNGTGGTLSLKHLGSTVLTTTSTGIDVTGNIELGSSHFMGDEGGAGQSENLYIKSSENNDVIIRAGVDSDSIRLQTSATDRFTIDAGGVGYWNGTSYIDSSRNLSNLGTISSGAITSTGNSQMANLVVTGDLTVQGTTTTVNTDDLNVKDKNITLNYSTGDSSASANGAGITIQDAVSATQDATLTWNTANDSFNFSHPLNVTGTVTSDGLTVDAALATINAPSNNADLILTEGGTNTDARIRNSNGILQIGADINNEFGASEMQFSVDGKEFLSIDRFGDISFYEDTGTTAKFFWDASSESLGIGTTNPNRELEIAGSSPDIRLTDTEGGYSEVSGSGGQFTFKADPANTQSGSRIAFEIDGSEKVRYNSTGVGIGTSSPDGKLHIKGGTATGDASHVLFENTQGSKVFAIGGGASGVTNNNLFFRNVTDNTTPMVITDAGKVGIGTSSPSFSLDVRTADNNVAQFKSTDASATVFIADNASSSAIRNNLGVLTLSADEGDTSSGTAIVFQTDTAERARIDGSGNLLVGKTSTSFTVAGTQLAYDGAIVATRSANPIITLNRLSTDGELQRFYKDGTKVGSINSNTGRLEVLSAGNNLRIGSDSTVRWALDTTRFYPVVDATYDIGLTGNRVRNLYLSGTAYTGGSFSAGATGNSTFFAEGAQHIFRRGSAGSYAEFGRFDTSGNLLVGKTSADDGAASGIEAQAGGALYLAKNAPNLYLNRLSTDGTIAEFKKDGSTVGSIATNNDDLLIYSTATGHKGLRFAGGEILPVSNAGALEDNTTDLGSTAYRFKNLQLSGTAFVDAINADGSTVYYSGTKLRTGSTSESQAGVSINTSTTGTGYLLFGDGTGASAYVGQIAYAHSDNSMQFRTAGAEKLRIDTSGNLLLGTTSESTWESAKGFRARQSGSTTITRDGNPPLYVNRLTSDGDIAVFKKGTATVGSIGVDSTDNLYIAGGSGSTKGIYFNDAGVIPATTGGGVVDNAVDLGQSGYRFKNLYLSGTANFGSLSDGTITITGFVDEDNMSSDSATLLPTQQSVKAYVDANSFTINNNADNRIITGTANAGTLNAETTLTYGTTGADLHITGGSIGGVPPILRLEDVGSSGKLAELNHISGTTTLISRNATSNGVIKFAGHNGTSETEYARIDSSGNLLVGKTSAALAGAGTAILSTGTHNVTVDGDTTLQLNRLTSDGNLITFYKNTSTVGSIGVKTDGLYIADAGVGLRFDSGGTDDIIPCNATGAAADGSINLGSSGARFKDLHLSGNANVGTISSGDIDVSATNTNGLSIIDSSNSNASPLIKVQGNRSDANESQSFTGGLALSALQTNALANDGKHIGTIYFGTNHTNGTAGNIAYSASISAKLSGAANSVTDMPTDLVFYTGSSGTSLGTANTTFGTERLRITSAGRLGLGTDSPATDLHIKNSASTILTLESGTTSDGIILFGDANDINIGSITYNHTANYMAFETADSERVRLDSSGRVGIGTTSPQESLHTTGNIRLGDSAPAELYTNSSELRLGVDRNNDNATSNITFYVNNSESARIDSSGRVGIGTASPDSNLEVVASSVIDSTSDTVNNVLIGLQAANRPTIVLDTADTTYTNRTWNITNVGAVGSLVIGRHGLDVLNLKNDGKVGIGTSSPTQKLEVSGAAKVTGTITVGASHTLGDVGQTDDFIIQSSEGNNLILKAGVDSDSLILKTTNTALTINPEGKITIEEETTIDDDINLSLSGSVKGKVGVSGSQGNDIYIASGTTSSTGFGLRFLDYTVTNAILPCRGDGSTVDDTVDLGNSGARFDDIYATNGTINTSDRNDKQDIQALTEAEQRVATACKGLIRRFKWQSAVTQKGDDARYHFGIIAQDLQDAFEAEGLDAGDYGMFISSTWTDDEGNEQTRLGVRYNELLAFIITTL